MGEFQQAVEAFEMNEREAWRRAALVAGYTVAPYRRGGRPLSPDQILREPEEMQSPEALAAYMDAEFGGPTSDGDGDKAAKIISFKEKRDRLRARMKGDDA